MIVEARPSKVSRMVFLDKDLEESDVPSVESVIGPPFPAISLNFLAIPVRPSADPLILSTSFECKSIQAFAGNLFSITSIEAVEAVDDTVVDAVIDADADDDDAGDADDFDDDNDDDDNDAVTADVAADVAGDVAAAAAAPAVDDAVDDKDDDIDDNNDDDKKDADAVVVADSFAVLVS